MKCDYCGQEENLPFTCNYCGGTFCAEHRLPESHACKGDLSKRVVSTPGVTRSFGSPGFPGTAPSRGASPYYFSAREVRDILVAWAALALAFTIAQERANIGGALTGGGVFQTFLVAFVAVGGGFVLHELMHKFTAERYGYWAEFRMWTMGIILALLTSALGFIFAAPGATYIQGYNVSERQNGLISLAGPLTNVVIAIVFLLVGIAGTGLVRAIGSLGASVNLFLALFNMLPVMPLDGAKVFSWNKPVWAAVFFPLLLVFLSLFLGL